MQSLWTFFKSCFIPDQKPKRCSICFRHPSVINPMHYAIHMDHLHCFQHAHEDGFEWTTTTSSFAGMCGSLEMLMYAHSHGCPWNESLCTLAAAHCHASCLQYAHENGCPWDVQTLMNVTTCSNIHAYIKKHEVINNICIACALQKQQYDKIPWDHPSLWYHESYVKYLKARRKIQRAMERAYLDPNYKICRRRLMKDYEQLCLDTKLVLAGI